MYSIDDGFGFNEMRETKVGRRENARRERRRKETGVVGVSFSLESKDNFLGRTDERVGFVSSAERVKGVEKFVRTKEHDRGVSDSSTEAEIIDLFDDVTVLSSGKLMYHGSMGALEGHFEKLGHKCPKGHNILEFVIDLISVDASTPETMLESERLIEEVAKSAYSSKSLSSSNTNKATAEGAPPASSAVVSTTKNKNHPIKEFCGQFPLLLARAFKQ